MAYVGLFVYSDTFLIKRKGDFIMALFVELFLLGVGLSMDAFAVSVCKGLGMRKLDKKQALIIGLYFGGFQALMPLIGWLAVSSSNISPVLTTGSLLFCLASSVAR